MANEAELLYELEPAIPFTVADGTAITKGAVLKLTDPFTAIITSGADDVIAGIAKEDKIASDGHTKLAVYLRGVFTMYASGSITVGDPVGVIATYTNYVATQDTTAQTLSGGRCLGTALETATNGQTLRVLVNVQQAWPAV